MRRLTVLLAMGLLLFQATDAWASGPGVGGRRVRLDKEPAGPYLLRAVISPTPPQVGNFNVEVRVEDQTGDVIENAEVLISAAPSDHESEQMQEIATHEFAPLPTEYAAHLPVPTAGLWEITIHVESSLGVGQVSFFQQIQTPSSISAWISVGAPFAGLLLLALLFVWLQRQSNKDQERSSTLN
ncbi:MAG: hypothetical protein PVI81_02295 [Anaerolineales bacterium]|jgi:hypothetical protein